MQKVLKILLATAFVLGMASTIVATAHPMQHADLMRDGHSQRALPVVPSAWPEGPNRAMNARCGTCST
jgi:hypothetical protein